MALLPSIFDRMSFHGGNEIPIRRMGRGVAQVIFSSPSFYNIIRSLSHVISLGVTSSVWESRQRPRSYVNGLGVTSTA